jgi:NAD(P)-dependent dehydrogenase (short-subunit alcohol dehydrogenase family)
MPRWGLGAYASSKAALETSLAAWRNECHRVRFGSVVVGSTIPTEFGRDFEAEILAAAFDVWARTGLIQEGFMDTHEVGRALAAIVSAFIDVKGIGVVHVVLRSPSPPMGYADAIRIVTEAAEANGLAAGDPA